MIRSDHNSRQPIIALHLHDPLELSHYYYHKMKNDDITEFICTSLQQQYCSDYHNPTMQYHEKSNRLALITSCLQDVEILTQRSALLAAGIDVSAHCSLDIQLPNVMSGLKRASSAVVNTAKNTGGGLVRAASGLKNTLLKSFDEKAQKKIITDKVTALLKNLDSYIRHYKDFETEWESIKKLVAGIHDRKYAATPAT